MKTITVDLGLRSYPVLIGSNLLQRGDILSPHLGQGQILLVTNDTVAPLYLELAMGHLPADRTHSLVLPDGEMHKTVATWSRILDELVRLQATRDACVIGLGGGVVGDMSGFAAASYMRGIDFIQMPTTLLAQVDASVGGKTGVNHPEGKNLIGAFHQPRAVLIDTATMETLPDREYRAGVAEVVKYGLISDAAFFDWLESNVEAVNARENRAVQHMVEASVRNKAQVVADDERESGKRALLNLGHSFGHAIETLTGYTRFLHGEAVAIGMVVAAGLSEARSLVPGGTRARIAALLARFGLPTEVPKELAAEDLFARLALDKKTLAGRLRLILLEGIGSARVDDASSRQQILEAIEDARA